MGLNTQRKENPAGNTAGRDQTQRDGEEAKLNARETVKVKQEAKRHD